MSHREHALRRNAEAVYAGLEQQIANLRSQFEAATERADRLEAELQAARGPMAAEKES
jgi:chaperonin cofactor prefoldin